MTQTQLDTIPRGTANLRKFLKAGLVAGLVSAAVNNIIYVIVMGIEGYSWMLVVPVSILLAPLLPNLLSSLAYFFLHRVTSKARFIPTVGIVAFVLISVLPHMGMGDAPPRALSALPPGFEHMTVPLHIILGLAAVHLMPWWVAKY